MSKERIQKLIAAAGVCSRRKAEQLILAGRIKMNNRVVRELGVKADPELDKLSLDGNTLEFQKKVYLLMNKPAQMITSHSDEAGRPVVYSLIKETRRLVTAGRLDYHTEGALLFTNDGKLVHKLTHPSSMVPKEYEVKVKGYLKPDQLTQIENGVLLEDGPTQPVMVEKLHSTEMNTWYQFILTEGKNREVRRIVEAVGASVLKLKRTSFAGLRVDTMISGEVRPLTAAEILMLYEAAGLYETEGTNSKGRHEMVIKARKAEKAGKSSGSSPVNRRRSYDGANQASKPGKDGDKSKPKRRGKKTDKPKRGSQAGRRGAGRNSTEAKRSKVIRRRPKKK